MRFPDPYSWDACVSDHFKFLLGLSIEAAFGITSAAIADIVPENKLGERFDSENITSDSWLLVLSSARILPVWIPRLRCRCASSCPRYPSELHYTTRRGNLPI